MANIFVTSSVTHLDCSVTHEAWEPGPQWKERVHITLEGPAPQADPLPGQRGRASMKPARVSPGKNWDHGASGRG